MSDIHNNYDIHFAIDSKEAESIFLLLCIFYCFALLHVAPLRVSYLCLIFIDSCIQLFLAPFVCGTHFA